MKILFIACYSPLINNSAAIETLQYLNKLSEIKGNEVHLLTVDFPQNSIYYDETLKEMMNKEIRLHLVDGGIIFKKLMPKKQNLLNGCSKDKKNRKTLRKIKNSIVIPDMYYGWSKRAAKYGCKLMDKEKFDVIFSMHEPPSSHLCAYKIKKRYNKVPWITYWSDPWLKDSTRENAFFLKKFIEKRMEKRIVNLADKFIFVTEANRDEYLKDYKRLGSENKTFILNRGFDAELYKKIINMPKPQFIKNDKVNIIYTGEIFSKLRDISPFVQAVEEMKKDKDAYSMLNILFFGNIDDEESRKKLNSLEVAKVSSRIPFNEALAYMLNGDILLLFGNKNSKQIPAKIYDYLGAEGKIFVIYGDKNDPIRKIVENNEKCVDMLNDKEEIKKNLYSMIQLYKEENLKSPADYNYEWNSIVERLNIILGGK